jgi:3-hydroxyacyl-CoA dehydrogenase
LGFESVIKRINEDGDAIPAWVLERLAEGKPSFYSKTSTDTPYISLNRETTPVVFENRDAAVVDIGDGVLCLEFRSKGNSLGINVIDIINATLAELNNDWNGLVIGNKGKFFSAGANLNDILSSIDKKAWKKIEDELCVFQKATSALKYAVKPVVSAPFGMTLGGGAEIVMHSYAATPSVWTNMGLVEASVGLVPGSGGCKEMLVWAIRRVVGTSKEKLLPAVKSVWRMITTANVSSNAFDAIGKWLMKPDTRVIMNTEALIDEAKAKVLELSRSGFMPPVPKKLPLLGEYGHAAISLELQTMRNGGFISDYDVLIADKLAFVLTGGAVVANTMADEEYILELEREAFLSLCGEEKTRQRIEHILKTGKPLRN